MKKIQVLAIAVPVSVAMTFGFIYLTTSLINGCSVRLKVVAPWVEVDTEMNGCSEAIAPQPSLNKTLNQTSLNLKGSSN